MRPPHPLARPVAVADLQRYGIRPPTRPDTMARHGDYILATDAAGVAHAWHLPAEDVINGAASSADATRPKAAARGWDDPRLDPAAVFARYNDPARRGERGL